MTSSLLGRWLHGSSGGRVVLYGRGHERAGTLVAKSQRRGAHGRASAHCSVLLAWQAQRRGCRADGSAAEHGGAMATTICRARSCRTSRRPQTRQAGQVRCATARSPAGAARIAAARGHGQLGWRLAGKGAERVGRCGVARTAQGRHPAAAPPLLVRQHRPRVRCQGRRRDWPVLESAAQRLGAQRGRETLDSSAGARAATCTPAAARSSRG